VTLHVTDKLVALDGRQTLRVVTARDLFTSSVVLLRPPYNIVRVKADGTSGFTSLSEKTRH
jgi:hypothetical protein